MKLISQSFNDGEAIPGEFAFAIIDPASHIALSTNRNPHLAWTDVPAETKSFVLICHDPNVPGRPDFVNQEGREVPAALPRIDFVHWLLLDIPASRREIAAGEYSQGITPRGKPGPPTPDGLRQGINDYTGWFANDPQMQGVYHGYDGPCPPWNDTIIHHYIFTLYAIDLPQLQISGHLTPTAVKAALGSHILAKTTLTGTYSLNPSFQAH